MCIYNNTKHYELEKGRRTVYVIENQKSLMPTDGKGNAIWTDDFIFYDDALWIDKCDGESDKLLLCCKIRNEDTGIENFIMLYEICKQIFDLYEKLI